MSWDAAPCFDARRARATWYSWLLTGFYLYSVNLQGNVVPFLQTEFALSYRAVSLHSSAIAAGIILVGLFGDRVERGSAGGGPCGWGSAGSRAAASCSASRRRRGRASPPAS
jgi:hypothetical protein